MKTALRAPAVSVITIFYNVSPYLAEAIDSVLAHQSAFNRLTEELLLAEARDDDGYI
jgi:glycosyltransferase involved in cell wall biosynthesis